MNDELIKMPSDTEAPPQTQMGLTIRQGDTETKMDGTPQQMRVIEVSTALEPAYRNASTLEMTDEEIEKLMMYFPDESVEIRPHDGLIYIPHIHISNRLNQIFKPGKWSLIKRRDWFDGDTTTMYGEYVLVIRGCFVGESIGGHPYVAKNPKTNFSDALESTAAEALRRIAGKRLSCGSQVWDPEYARQWVAKYSVQVGGKYQRRMTQDAPKAQAAPRPAPKTNAPQAGAQAQEPAKSQAATNPAAAAENAAKWKTYALAQIKKFAMEPFAYAVAIEDSWVVPGVDKLEDISPQKFPNTQQAWADYYARLKGRKQRAIDEGGMPQDITEAFDKAYLELPMDQPLAKEAAAPPNVARSVPPPINVPQRTSTAQAAEWFLDVVVPIPHKGEKRDEYLKNPDTIGSLYDASKDDEDARRRLFGFAEHYQPEGWVKRDGTKMPPNEVDVKFREALDAFMDWREAKGNDDDLPF